MSTDTTTATDTPPASPVRERLRAAAQKRTTTAKRRTVRKTAPATSRASAAARKGRHADRIAATIKTGATLYAIRNPVRAAILTLQADPLAAALDRVAAEDKRVDELLTKLGGIFGKGGAWGDLGMVGLQTFGAMALAGGAAPSGPLGMVLAFVAGDLVQAAAMEAATQIATAEAAAAGADTPDPDRVAQLAGELLAPPTPPPAAGDEATTSGDHAPYGRDSNGAPHTAETAAAAPPWAR